MLDNNATSCVPPVRSPNVTNSAPREQRLHTQNHIMPPPALTQEFLCVTVKWQWQATGEALRAAPAPWPRGAGTAAILRRLESRASHRESARWAAQAAMTAELSYLSPRPAWSSWANPEGTRRWESAQTRQKHPEHNTAVTPLRMRGRCANLHGRGTWTEHVEGGRHHGAIAAASDTPTTRKSGRVAPHTAPRPTGPRLLGRQTRISPHQYMHMTIRPDVSERRTRTGTRTHPQTGTRTFVPAGGDAIESSTAAPAAALGTGASSL